MNTLNGILPLNKPKGMTSHDCVMKIRKLLNVKKMGHTGTLDPDVDGVLPICIGRATKVVEYMMEYPKTYEAVITLGIATTTEDATGQVIAKKDITSPITPKQIQTVLTEMEGKIKQVPPMYSAVKVNGKRLYEYAFEGKTIARPQREVTIHKIELLTDKGIDNHQRSFPIRVTCSKGTYIRTLAVDIGKKLGYPAHMEKLTRTKSGPFILEETCTFREIEQAVLNEQIQTHLHSIDKAVAHFEKKVVSDIVAAKIENGTVLPQFKHMEKKRYTIYNTDGELLAIYIPHPEKQGLMKPEKMIKVKGN
ncbi:tRNA pseudouridine(55) synthase TruB [Pueribacillus sp. YX66]|uniref:tRNA pseudouridine(55) synthase TruB n=1 Tax=Pueribacillus sp. YX66 TaxID=3229242 RepID=UPI00358D5D0B